MIEDMTTANHQLTNNLSYGDGPVDTRYLGYSWRYAVGMQRYPYSGLLDAITECVIYNSRYVQYVPDTECLYKIRGIPSRSQSQKGDIKPRKTIEKY